MTLLSLEAGKTVLFVKNMAKFVDGLKDLSFLNHSEVANVFLIREPRGTSTLFAENNTKRNSRVIQYSVPFLHS